MKHHQLDLIRTPLQSIEDTMKEGSQIWSVAAIVTL